jgi:hypothetical protein
MAVLSSSSFDSWNTPLSNRNCAFVFMTPRSVLSEAKVLPTKRISLIVVGTPSEMVNTACTVPAVSVGAKAPVTVASV